MGNEEGTKTPDQTIELHSKRETTGYADLPNGGRIRVDASSGSGVNDDQVYVQMASRKLRSGQTALLPAGSFGVELKLGIDPNPPNRPNPPNFWRATIYVYRN